MIYFLTILFGIIQGLTEFLPVSSSGHLVILHRFLDLAISDDLAFDVALHLGTLAALAVFFYTDIIKYLAAFLKSLRHWDLKNNLDQRLAWLILLSMIPAGLIGFFYEQNIENLFRSALSVAVVLILVSFLFWLAEKYSRQQKDLSSLTWQKSLIIGCAQAVALIPGVSRSGITIITGMAFNLKREVAARFSFLISIPIVFAAGVKKMLDLWQNGLNTSEMHLYILGFVSATLTGYYCVKYFLQFVKNYSLNWFALYRIILGIIILILIFV